MAPAPASPPHGKDIRDAFFDEVYQLAKQDPRVMVLTDDQGAFALDRIRSDFPAQYINVGIAEQNLIAVSAGMALGGLRPYVCGISNFMSLRCCEQISVNLAAMNLPVTIVASGGGLSYSKDGPTHHSTQDVAVMRSMPNFTILNPSDANLTAACARFTHTLPGPSYVRIEKGLLPGLHPSGVNVSAGHAPLGDGGDVLIVSTGYMSQVAVLTAAELERLRIRTGVLDLFRIKPVDSASLLQAFRRCEHLVVLEEQTPVGGIGDLVGSLLAKAGLHIPLQCFSLPDAPCHAYGSRDWLHRLFNLDPATLARQIAKWLDVRPEPESTRNPAPALR